MRILVTDQPQLINVPLTARIAIRNIGENTIWIGHASNVTPATAFPIYAGEGYEFPADRVAHGELWVVAETSATTDLRVLTVG